MAGLRGGPRTQESGVTTESHHAAKQLTAAEQGLSLAPTLSRSKGDQTFVQLDVAWADSYVSSDIKNSRKALTHPVLS